ncbi:HNH endonuclease signature motif containing protein [Micrococcoides hystricis]|uniref:HNH endonuclease signature motif containing protein n=1 Tax=Micrococcoides hystricis TaxID=1572761 RepID=A0ABV6P9X6_9MICC
MVKRLLALRDQHCRYPGCRAPATMCETDHVHPFAESGQTAYGNLALWCKEHHTGKTARWWDVTPLPAQSDGALQIPNKGSGQTHISQPELPLHPAAWADHQQRQDQANAPPF